MPHYLLCEPIPSPLHVDLPFSSTLSAMAASKIPYIVPPSVIAAKLGMDRTHISRILRGERVADTRLLQQIAKASSVSVSELEAHIQKAHVLSRQGTGRRKKAPSKVDEKVRGLILRCWNDPSGRPTYKAIVEQIEAETGVKVSRETVRQAVLKASRSSRQAA